MRGFITQFNCQLKHMQNFHKQFLKPLNPVFCVPTREAVTAVMSNPAPTSLATMPFEATISLATPLSDYKELISTRVEVDEYVEEKILQANFRKIATAAQEAIWRLLFAEETAEATTTTTPTTAAKASENTEFLAAELLKIYKIDARFHSPWEYNTWVVKLRDELLRCGKLKFWRDVVVKHELGPCWARDSDYFDDIDDPEPAKFYEHAGCVAPFASGGGGKPTSPTVATEATEALSELPATNSIAVKNSTATEPFEAQISLQAPMNDYKRLMDAKVLVDEYVNEQILQNNFKKIAIAMQEAIWQLLFGERASEETAALCLKAYKIDARFHSPWEYNSWIVKLRDELLRREKLTFWRDVVVKYELGPCWARDSDYFDEIDDPEPAKFYEHAGCVAPFKVAEED